VSSRWSAAASSSTLDAVEVGHARVQERRRLVRGFELFSRASFRLLSAFISSFTRALHAVLDGFDDLLDLALDALELALGAAQAGPLLHPQPVHLLRELAAELLEEVLAHQLLLKRSSARAPRPPAADRQLVRAGAALARAEAAELLAE
jgi:hypothetical protein